MTARKTPTARRALGNADAREMLLAHGIPVPDEGDAQDALERLTAAAKGSERVYTREEFCERYKVSESRFFRMRRDKIGPRCFTLPGSRELRVTHEDAEAWLAAQLATATPAELTKLKAVDVIEVVKPNGKHAAANKPKLKTNERVVGKRIAGSRFIAPVAQSKGANPCDD